MADNVILSANGVSAGYNRKDVIKDVSFSVSEGSFLGIIGPNGSGKTTLFRALTAVLPLSSGSAFYKGKDIHGIDVRELAKEVAAMPQIVDMPFSFTVEEFVFLARFAHLGRFDRPKDTDFKAVEDALSLTDTAALRKRNMSELSGGERQRVSLAQSFAQSPRLLFLDEPTAHLDIAHQIAIMDILKKLNEEQAVSVIVILHDLNLAAEYCKKLILLNNGKIFAKGGVDEIITENNVREVYGTEVLKHKNIFYRAFKGNPC